MRSMQDMQDMQIIRIAYTVDVREDFWLLEP